jgi:hypothetical protein
VQKRGKKQPSERNLVEFVLLPRHHVWTTIILPDEFEGHCVMHAIKPLVSYEMTQGWHCGLRRM